MNPQTLVFDTLDDRRESFRLLETLDDRQRLTFLRYCAKHVGQWKIAPKVVSRNGVYNAADAWYDFWALCGTWQLDAAWGLRELEAFVRKGVLGGDLAR